MSSWTRSCWRGRGRLGGKSPEVIGAVAEDLLARCPADFDVELAGSVPVEY